jgi:hypothetical protein
VNTKTLDELAERGVRFDQAITAAQDLSPDRSLAAKRLVGAVARRVVAP